MEAWEGLVLGHEPSQEERAARSTLPISQQQLGQEVFTPLESPAKERFAQVLLRAQEPARRRRFRRLFYAAPMLLAAACLLILVRPVPAMGPLCADATSPEALGAQPAGSAASSEQPIGPRDTLRLQLQPLGSPIDPGEVRVFLGRGEQVLRPLRA